MDWYWPIHFRFLKNVSVPCQVSKCTPRMEPWPKRDEKLILSPLWCSRPTQTQIHTHIREMWLWKRITPSGSFWEVLMKLPVYDNPQLSSSLPNRLQNVCLYLSRFTSEVPIPTICGMHTQESIIHTTHLGHVIMFMLCNYWARFLMPRGTGGSVHHKEKPLLSPQQCKWKCNKTWCFV